MVRDEIKGVCVRLFMIPSWLCTILSKFIEDHAAFSKFYILSLNIIYLGKRVI